MNLNHFYHYYKSKSGGLSNLLLGSEELDQSDQGEWVRYNMNAVNANVPGVANPLSSDETVEQLDFEASTVARIAQTVTLTAGTEYTFSVWARAASGTKPFRLRYWDNVGGSGGGSAFTASATWSPSTGRYEMTFTAQNSGTFQMFIQNAGGTAASRRIYFWGAMLNVGATALDYVKTEFPIGLSNPPTPPMEFGDNFAGVTAYYSLRRFTKGEDNNAIRVRRSSDDTEQDIGFDTNGDLDTTALLAFVGSQNLIFPSEDFGGASYTKQTGITATSNTSETTDPLGGSAAAKIVSTDATKGFFISGLSFPTSSDLIRSIYLKGAVGGETAVLKDPSGYGGSTAVTLTTEWQRFTHSTSAGITDAQGIFVDDISVGTIYAFGAQCNEGTTATTYNKTTTGIGGDGAVTKWYDQSGGNDAINADASEQPLVVSGGSVVTENSKAAIDFDGVDDYFTGAVKTTMDNTAIFAVIKSDSNTQDSVFIQNTVDINNCVALGLGGLSTNSKIGSRLRVGGSTIDRVGDATFTATDQTLVSYLADNTAGQMFIDGTEETDIVDSRSEGTATTIGARGDGNSPFNGAIQEVIFFESDQSSNRTNMETNINDHFSIYEP